MMEDNMPKLLAKENLAAGDLLVCCKNGKVRRAKNDMSLKARIIRWWGRTIKKESLKEYGLENDMIVGMALEPSYKNENGKHIVKILVR
jgi:hypothetical protein